MTILMLLNYFNYIIIKGPRQAAEHVSLRQTHLRQGPQGSAQLQGQSLTN